MIDYNKRKRCAASAVITSYIAVIVAYILLIILMIAALCSGKGSSSDCSGGMFICFAPPINIPTDHISQVVFNSMFASLVINTSLFGGVAFGVLKCLSNSRVIAPLSNDRALLLAFSSAFGVACAITFLIMPIMTLMRYFSKSKSDRSFGESLCYAALDSTWCNPIGFVSNLIFYLADLADNGPHAQTNVQYGQQSACACPGAMQPSASPAFQSGHYPETSQPNTHINTVPSAPPGSWNIEHHQGDTADVYLNYPPPSYEYATQGRQYS